MNTDTRPATYPPSILLRDQTRLNKFLIGFNAKIDSIIITKTYGGSGLVVKGSFHSPGKVTTYFHYEEHPFDIHKHTHPLTANLRIAQSAAEALTSTRSLFESSITGDDTRVRSSWLVTFLNALEDASKYTHLFSFAAREVKWNLDDISKSVITDVDTLRHAYGNDEASAKSQMLDYDVYVTAEKLGLTGNDKDIFTRIYRASFGDIMKCVNPDKRDYTGVPKFDSVVVNVPDKYRSTFGTIESLPYDRRS